MKGIINENIGDILNLRPLDEVIKEQAGEDAPQPQPQPAPEPEVEIEQTVNKLREMSTKLAMVEGTDHAEAMDELHVEILTHARDLMSYGFNIDHPRARGIFEIAAMMYNHAITAKNSKRDAQLKSMKLALDKKRVELEEKRTNHVIGATPAADVGDTILVEDRNELLRRLRQQIADKDVKA
jgi:hypothetical protein